MLNSTLMHTQKHPKVMFSPSDRTVVTPNSFCHRVTVIKMPVTVFSVSLLLAAEACGQDLVLSCVYVTRDGGTRHVLIWPDVMEASNWIYAYPCFHWLRYTGWPRNSPLRWEYTLVEFRTTQNNGFKQCALPTCSSTQKITWFFSKCIAYFLW